MVGGATGWKVEGPWADLADDLHGANAIDVDSRSITRECDRQRSKGKSRKVDKVFKAGGNYARRIAESGIVHASMRLSFAALRIAVEAPIEIPRTPILLESTSARAAA